MVFWKASFCEPFKNKLVSLLVSLRTTSEPLLQLTSSRYEYAQYFWRSQECPLFQVSHLCPCPIGQAWGSSSSPESLCSGRRASSGEGALTHQPGPWAGWWEGRAWGALQQGPLAQSKCSQSHVLALLSRERGVPAGVLPLHLFWSVASVSRAPLLCNYMWEIVSFLCSFFLPLKPFQCVGAAPLFRHPHYITL